MYVSDEHMFQDFKETACANAMDRYSNCFVLALITVISSQLSAASSSTSCSDCRPPTYSGWRIIAVNVLIHTECVNFNKSQLQT